MCLFLEFCEVVYMCVDLYRKNVCFCCSKDINCVCDCGVDVMLMLNLDDFLGLFLNCWISILLGKNDFFYFCVSFDGIL